MAARGSSRRAAMTTSILATVRRVMMAARAWRHAVDGPRHADAGFSLVEVIIAMGILATGLLSLAGVFTLGMRHLAGSSYNLIAREKAREAVESVHTARD